MTRSQSIDTASLPPTVSASKPALSSSGASLATGGNSLGSAQPAMAASAPPVAQASIGTASKVGQQPITASAQTQAQSSFDWPLYLAWSITAIGWLVTHSLTERRERRKERRAEVDACCKLTAELLVKARAYYAEIGASDKAKLLAPEIRFEVQRVLKRIERLQKLCPKFQMEPALDALMESVIGDDFDSHDRPVAALGSPRLIAIDQACHLVMDSLEDGFTKTYDESRLRRMGSWLAHRS